MVGRMFNPSMSNLPSRLTSFAGWPNNVAVKPKDLAETGFYYMGTDDTVCCFSCGETLSGWQIGDIPEEKHRRKSGNRCEFLQRQAMDTLDSSTWSGMNQNIPVRRVPSFDPIDNDMENEGQRLRSFQRNNGWRGAVDPQKLAAAGFYYTGIHDHVKCFACDVSLKAWLPNDDPITEHLKNEPNCPYISRFSNKFSITYLPNVALQESGSASPNFRQTLRSTSFDQNVVYHPPSAVNTNRLPVSKPNYASEHARLHTFINWPKNCPVQPKELIDAGFYYTGNGDKVECFKCGIILAGWEQQDTPWGEHEKWSKNCPLVVEHLNRRNPHSPIRGSRAQEQAWDTPPKVSGPVAGPSETEEFTKEAEVVRLSPKEAEHSTQAGEHKTMENSGAGEIFYLERGVQKLFEEGRYDYALLKEAVQQRTKIEGKPINSMDELLDAVRSYQKMATQISAAVNSPTSSGNILVQPGEVVFVDPKTLQDQVQKLEDAHRCKICLDREVGIVFLPCGHLVCCPKCAQELQAKREPLCPICRRRITNTIRSYLT